MALIKPTSPRASTATGGVFDLSDLREGAARALREANEEAARIFLAKRQNTKRGRRLLSDSVLKSQCGALALKTDT